MGNLIAIGRADLKPDNIPGDLKRDRSWVIWRAAERKSKVTKEPRSAHTGALCSVTDPASLSTFADAASALETYQADGIGYAFSGAHPVSGVDIDDCLDAEGRMHPAAADLIGRLPGYWEVSPSGRGVKGFVRAEGVSLASGTRLADYPAPGITTEVYSSSRYFTVTGHAHELSTADSTLPEAAGQLASLFDSIEQAKAERRPAPVKPQRRGALPVNFSDRELLDVARRASNGTKFAALYDQGDYHSQGYNDQSAADSALCCTLAFYFGADTGRVDTAFRASALMRDKWDRSVGGGETYGQRTVARACEMTREHYSPRREADQVSASKTQPKSQKRPTISLRPSDLYACKRRLAEALEMMEHPGYFDRDDEIVLVRSHRIVQPSVSRLRSELVENLRFIKVKVVGDEEIEVDIHPPKELLESLRDTPAHFALPVLRDFTVAPVVLPDGTITTKAGYYADAQAYYSGKVSCGNVPDNPTEADIRRAVALLEKPLQDFPFASTNDRANVIGLMLAIVGRAVIGGLTPAHMLCANTPGTGKGLLAEVISQITTGEAMETTPWTSDGEEFRKSVTTRLMQGARIVQYDNINDEIDSGNFAAVVTCRRWQDRQLGGNTSVSLENRTIFMATANNLAMSSEVQRRFITAELATTMENPADRSGFAIENLPDWVAKNQKALLAALLTLWRSWFAAGKPMWRERKLGSFEEYCQIIGGVLQVAGIEGFLANKERVRADADSETSEWRRFISEWWRLYGEKPVTSTQLQTVCIYEDSMQTVRRAEPLLLSVLGSGNERSQQSRLGHRLKGMRNRVFGLYQIRKSSKTSPNTLYELHPTEIKINSSEKVLKVLEVLSTEEEQLGYAEKDVRTFDSKVLKKSQESPSSSTPVALLESCEDEFAPSLDELEVPL